MNRSIGREINTNCYFCVKGNVGNVISAMKWKMQYKENLHELHEVNYPKEIKDEILLPDDEEYHRGKSKIDDVLSYIESHCNTRQKPKQKYKRNL